MSYYGWTLEEVEDLTFDQIKLWHHLATKNESERLKAQASLIAQLLAK
jgi:hypothetical protein